MCLRGVILMCPDTTCAKDKHKGSGKSVPVALERHLE